MIRYTITDRNTYDSCHSIQPDVSAESESAAIRRSGIKPQLAKVEVREVMSVAELKKLFREKWPRYRIQAGYHGCYEASIQIFRKAPGSPLLFAKGCLCEEWGSGNLELTVADIEDAMKWATAREAQLA